MMSSRPARLARSLCGALVLAVCMAACGFHMRGASDAYRLPFASIYLTFSDNSPLGVELKRNIRAISGTEVVSDPKAAQVIMEVLGETRDKSILSLNSQGRVREYLLTYTLRFHVKDKAEHELLPSTDIVLKRTIAFNEAQVLGKEAEEALLYRDMQTDLVQQVLRRLASMPAPAPVPPTVPPPAPAPPAAAK